MPEKIKKHLAKDMRLAPLLEQITLPTLEVSNDIYEILLDSIVSQQLSVKAAGTIFNRFLDIFPNRQPAPEWVLACDPEVMRRAGLSYQKAGYIQNIARYWLDNKAGDRDWQKIPDEEIIAELVSIKGVGRWTVQMMLMFRLGRTDVFPIDDLGIRQGMTYLYGLEDVSGKELLVKLNEISETWRPYRAVACRYIWRWKDTVKATK
jgi:DNA-3-methyladenine glycosylase II